MRPRLSESQWRRIFDQFDRSGLTQEAFCHREDLAHATFANWRRKLRAAGLAPIQGGFVELCIPGKPRAAEPLRNPDGELVVELPFGVVLRFRGVRA